MTYIGIDIGDGESAVTTGVYQVATDEHKRNTFKQHDLVLDGLGNSIPSIFAVPPNSNCVVIGRNALSVDSKGSLSEFAINFKHAPSFLKSRGKLEAFERSVLRFGNELLKLPRVRDVFSSGETEFVISFGHPTGWSSADVEAYMAILMKLDIFAKTDAFFGREGVHVTMQHCPESHAALLHLSNRVFGDLKKDPVELIRLVPKGRFLIVIDFGSSTTDISVVMNSGLLTILPDGETGNLHLGARYIDRAIFRLVVERLEPDDRKKLEAYLAANQSEEARMIGFCRLAKEAFFSAPAEARARGDVAILNPNGLAGRIFPLSSVFFGTACGEIMQAALNMPIEEFEGRSWLEECRALLQRVADDCRRRGADPATIYLTGGAGRMDFISDFAKEIFENSQIVKDPFPATCISSGLCLMPYKLLEAKAFLGDVGTFVSRRIPEIVKAKLSSLAYAVAERLEPKISTEAVRQARRWRNGHVDTLAGMEMEITAGVERLLTESEAQLALQDAVGDFLRDELVPKVNAEFSEICVSHKLRKDRLQCSKNDVQIRGDGIAVDVPFDTEIVDAIVKKVLGSVVGIVVACLASAFLALANVIAIPIASAIGLAIVNALLAAVAALGVTAPVILPIVAIVGLLALVAGTEAAKNGLRTRSIPNWVRTRVISESKIGQIVDGEAWRIKGQIRSAILSSDDFTTQVAETFSISLKQHYESEAQDLALHIYG